MQKGCRVVRQPYFYVVSTFIQSKLVSALNNRYDNLQNAKYYFPFSMSAGKVISNTAPF